MEGSGSGRLKNLRIRIHPSGKRLKVLRIWIRDPVPFWPRDPEEGFLDLEARIPNPYFSEPRDNFLGKKYYNSLWIGQKMFWYEELGNIFKRKNFSLVTGSLTMRIGIRGFVPTDYRSGSGFCFVLHWLSRWQQRSHTHKAAEIEFFPPFYFTLVMEVSGFVRKITNPDPGGS